MIAESSGAGDRVMWLLRILGVLVAVAVLAVVALLLLPGDRIALPQGKSGLGVIPGPVMPDKAR